MKLKEQKKKKNEKENSGLIVLQYCQTMMRRALGEAIYQHVTLEAALNIFYE